MEEDNCIHGVFAFIIGEDPTYRIIENGEWKSDTLYGTIHRLASTGYTKNVFHEVMNFCLQKFLIYVQIHMKIILLCRIYY